MVKASTRPTRSQPSRKGAKAWRKNIDITDVEEHLEQTRKDAMAGGPVEAKLNEQLFVVDTAGADAARHQRQRAAKPLRIDTILGERSAIHALGGQRTLSAAVAGKKSKGLSKNTLKAVRKQLATAKGEKVMQDDKCSATDVWSTNEPIAEVQSDQFGAVIKKPATAGQLPPVAVTIPAVDVAHPGTSYNPSPADLQDAIQQAYQQELARIEAAQKLEQMSAHKNTLLSAQRQPLHTTMTVDLPSDDDADDNEADEETATATKPVRRKTKKDRKRDQLERDQALAIKSAQTAKQLDNQLNQLKSIAAQVAATQNKQADRASARASRIEHAKNTQPTRLSKHLYTPLPMTIKLSDELADSLRTLKPESNLFKERFNQLQKRNLIEARVPVTTRRRYQLKDYEKHTYKRFDQI